jgi:hypothetical protein
VRLEFDEPALPRVLQPYEGQIGAVCTIVCPNRLAFYLACGIAGAGILAVRWLSLYSRRVRSATEAVLLTPILTLVLAVLLVLIVTCDRDAQVWAPLALAALFAAVAGLLILGWRGRRLDGPIP